MSPQRRTALVSVGAAVALMGIKLGTGLASGSLGLVSEALHSGTDLVAALLTFFAIGVAGRPADRSHPYGHGKAEHLAALAEAFVLLLVSLAVGALALARLAGWIEIETSTAWWVFAAVGVVIMIDVSRTLVSLRAARLFESPALASNALHFGSDLVGTLAVLAASSPSGRLARGRLGRRAVRRVPRRHRSRPPDPAERRRAHGPGAGRRGARCARRDCAPRSTGRAPPAASARGRRSHVHRRRHRRLPRRRCRTGPRGCRPRRGRAPRSAPGSDVVVHVEPAGVEAALRERVRESAMSVSRVREIHNLSVIELPDGVHVSLHLKLPGELPLDEAHTIAEHVERAITEGVREVVDVQTHLEPLAEPAAGREARRGPGRDRAARPRRDGRAAAGGSLSPHRRGPRRLPDARARSGREPRRRTCDGHRASSSRSGPCGCRRRDRHR